MPRRTLLLTAIAALAATVLGILVGLLVVPWFPAQAASQAHNTDRLFYVLVIVSVPIFVLVATVILYSVWHFRMRPGQELQDGPPIHGSTRLEFVWTMVPAVLILALVAYSFVVLHNNEKQVASAATASHPDLQVNVTAQQFYWTYEYPATVTGGPAVNASELYLPKGQSVNFNLRSKDVIHAFWIPAFRLQEDVVPGVTTHYRATPTRIGAYPVVCNLLCGLGHAVMRSTVHVVSPSAFQAWLHSQKASSPPPGGTGNSSPTAPQGANSNGSSARSTQSALSHVVFSAGASG